MQQISDEVLAHLAPAVSELMERTCSDDSERYVVLLTHIVDEQGSHIDVFATTGVGPPRLIGVLHPATHGLFQVGGNLFVLQPTDPRLIEP